MSLTSWAAPNAERLLSPLGNRWRHVRQVAEQARRLVAVVPPEDRDLLVAAAYLHDVPGVGRCGALGLLLIPSTGSSGQCSESADTWVTSRPDQDLACTTILSNDAESGILISNLLSTREGWSPRARETNRSRGDRAGAPAE